MNVLVAGGRGWIGSAVCRCLDEAHFSFKRYDLQEGHDLINITDLCDTIEQFKIDTIINCAGEVREAASKAAPLKYWRNNSYAAQCLFEVAHKLELKVVHLSSPAVEAAEITPYGASKAAAEQAARQYIQAGAEIVMLRLFNVYGPGQPEDFFIPSLFSKILAVRKTHQEQKVTVTYGRNRRDYVYLDDVAEAIVAAVGLTPHLHPYEIGTGDSASDEEIVQLAQKITGTYLPTRAQDPPQVATIRVARPERNMRANTQLTEGMYKVWHAMSSQIA